jgi:hypothetical protein
LQPPKLPMLQINCFVRHPPAKTPDILSCFHTQNRYGRDSVR